MSSQSRRVIRERLAESDLEEHVDYFAEKSRSVAIRFIDAAERAFKRIGEMPEIGGIWKFENPRLADIRVRPIPGFRNILIFYRLKPNDVQVLRILHGLRDLEQLLIPKG
jgi:toxin ParE1/3/4